MILARPRYEYQSYWDLYELARLSGVEIVFFDEIVWDSDNVYIVSPINGELPNPLPPHKCQIIWLNIERPTIADGWRFDRPDFDRIWVCDNTWAKRTGSELFVMGSHAGLGRIAPKRYDWISCTYNTNRRQLIWSLISDLSMAPNGWPISIEDRANALAAARLYVVPQQDEPPHAVTPLRFAIAAAYKLPMIYEAAKTDLYPFVDGVDVIHAPYGDFPNRVRQALANPAIVDIGEALHQRLCVDTDFRRSIESII